MPNSGNFTIFGTSVSGAAANSNSEYLNSNFLNTTENANSNQGFTSTALTNPSSFYFTNDDMPRYQAKTVYVNDLVLLEDRSRWVNNKPTYQIVWSEPQPHIQGYAWGNIRLKNSNFGKCVSVIDIDDGIAICGVIRQVGWMVNPVNLATATADKWTDGVDLSQTISFADAPLDSMSTGYNKYNVYWHSSSLQTRNIHEYRLLANQYQALTVSGVVAYFENSTSDIDQFPGTSYVTMYRQSTSVGTHIATPSISGNIGGRSSIAKTLLNTYQTNTSTIPYINTVANGASGTNLVTVTTGQGGSFPIGCGVAAILGTTNYIGTVTNQSTDTLTVSPTLPFGISGLLFRSWQAGPTFSISASLYTKAFTIDPVLSNTIADGNGFGENATGALAYSHPENKYRIWGSNLTIQPIEGYKGFGFISNTLGFFQVDGNFCAAEIEIAGAGIIHGTFAINGVPAWGLNEGFSSILRKTVFTNAGAGWNSFSFTPGTSFINTSFFRINLYNQVDSVGMTNTLLGSLDTNVTPMNRFGDVSNATLTPMGNWQRIFADQCYFSGPWSRGVTSGVAGGVQFIGSSTNAALNFQYFGTDFAVLGAVSSSAVLTLDGAPVGCSLNLRIPVAGGATFHSVVYTNQSGTSIIHGFDFLKPTIGEIKNNQNYSPRVEFNQIPRVFNQSDTPRNPKDFDIWASDKFGRVVLMYLFGKWNQIIIGNPYDDPNDIQLYRIHGSPTAAAGGANGAVEMYNFFSWSIPQATSSTNAWSGQIGDAGFNGSVYWIDGLNTSDALSAITEAFNKFSFSTGPNRSTTKSSGGVGLFNFQLYVGKGQAGGGTPTSGLDAYNGSSWTNAVTTLSTASSVDAAFVYANKFRVIAGYNGGSINVHATYDGASSSTDTVYPTSDTTIIGGSSNANGIVGGGQSNATASYSWSGSWSSSITLLYSVQPDAGTAFARGTPVIGNYQRSRVYMNGGKDSGASAINRTSFFTGTSWISDTNSSTSTTATGGGII